MIPKTSDQYSRFGPCFVPRVHRLSTYEAISMFRFQGLSSSGWKGDGSKTTEFEDYGAANDSLQLGHSAKVFSPFERANCLMNRFGAASLQTDLKVVA